LKPEGKSPAETELAAALGLGWPSASTSSSASRQRTGKLSKTSARRSAKRSTAARGGSDEGISGAKGRDKCPAFDRLQAVGSDVGATPDRFQAGSNVGSSPNRAGPTGIANGRYGATPAERRSWCYRRQGAETCRSHLGERGRTFANSRRSPGTRNRSPVILSERGAAPSFRHSRVGTPAVPPCRSACWGPEAVRLSLRRSGFRTILG